MILPKDALNRCVNDDDWVRREIIEAVRCDKVIIPIMYDGFEWPKKWNAEIPKEFYGLEKNNGVSGTQEYLPAMIDKIISYMPQELIHLKYTFVSDTRKTVSYTHLSCFAVTRENTTLMNILNKTIQTLPDSRLSSLFSVYENTPGKVTLAEYIKDNLRVVSIGFVSVALIIILIIGYLMIKARKAQIQAEKANAAKSDFLFNM